MASFQDVALNPVSCIIMASIASIGTLVVHKYFLTVSETESESIFKMIMRNYSKVIFRIVFSFLGIIITSIVVATRDGYTPALLSKDYDKTAGF
jgi:hypothetical protein